VGPHGDFASLFDNGTYFMKKYFAGFVLPLDPEFLTAIGGVLVQWGIFEDDFDKGLSFLRWAPASRLLSNDLPQALERRIDLFKASARATFASCPSLAEKFVTIAGEAKATARDRNLVAHGRWGVGPGSVRVGSAKKRQHRTMTIADLQTLQDRISENHWRLLMMIDPPWPNQGLRDQYLSPGDQDALRQHWRSHSPALPLPNALQGISA
jgi:hypothetical protein